MTKSLVLSMLVFLAMLFSSPTAMADETTDVSDIDELLSDSEDTSENGWFISIEIPRSYVFKTAGDDERLEAEGNPIGLLFYLQSPFFGVGAGLENYEIKLDEPGNNKISITMADVYCNLPIPFVKIGLGLGAGYSEFLGDNSKYFNKSTNFQYFARLGIPIGDVIQLHLSYHQVFSRIEFKDSDYLLEAGGTMTSMGVSIGF
ncbi:MAG: hypothetical protein GY866_25140 [Proteobacteria bacterium]|nr:hypothetical protein [Pseudomonadota bacterium]